MTYRQIYAALHSAERAKTIHLGFCPDHTLQDSLTLKRFKCLGGENADINDPGIYETCSQCWDREAPCFCGGDNNE